jgi:hypothetical protein
LSEKIGCISIAHHRLPAASANKPQPLHNNDIVGVVANSVTSIQQDRGCISRLFSAVILSLTIKQLLIKRLPIEYLFR